MLGPSRVLFSLIGHIPTSTRWNAELQKHWKPDENPWLYRFQLLKRIDSGV